MGVGPGRWAEPSEARAEPRTQPTLMSMGAKKKDLGGHKVMKRVPNLQPHDNIFMIIFTIGN